MLYKKDRYSIVVSKGSGKFITGELRGVVHTIIIEPLFKEKVTYNLSIEDFENDELFFRNSLVNKVHINADIPVGKSTQESLIIYIKNVKINRSLLMKFIKRKKPDKFKVIFIVQER